MNNTALVLKSFRWIQFLWVAALTSMPHFTFSAGLTGRNCSQHLGGVRFVPDPPDNPATAEGFSGKVYVSDETGFEVDFHRSNRGLKFFLAGDDLTYPRRFLDIQELKGLSVLDAATGDGRFVFELHDAGVEHIIGGDLYLTVEQKIHPELFVAMDVSKFIPYPDETFDVIYCNHGPLLYPASINFYRSILKNFSRVLKTGGKIRLMRLNDVGVKQALQDLPILKPTPNSESGIWYTAAHKFVEMFAFLS